MFPFKAAAEDLEVNSLTLGRGKKDEFRLVAIFWKEFATTSPV